LLKYIFNKIYKSKTPAQRFKKSIYLLKFKKFNRFFKVFTANAAGRNNLGRITVFSKGVKKKLLHYQILFLLYGIRNYLQ
jgi:ribosomal protein L2